ncbi:G-protein coupled receptor moody-like [Diadema antillarum]|uniref:G-protein coupled receptor moody-like n=1 Tax=Diadema antillarum TaxID=105358 RepID=UPI003A841431
MAAPVFITVLREYDIFFENLTTTLVPLESSVSTLFSTSEVIFVIFALAAISFCGIVGNVCTVLAVLVSPQLQTTTNVFVVSLSINDFLSCLTLPFQILTTVRGKVLPDWFCQILGAMLMSSIGTSALTLSMIAINRWFLITKGRHVYARVYNKKNASLMILFVWSYSYFMCAGVSYFGPGKIGYSNWPYVCTYNDDGTIADSYSTVMATTTLFPAFIITSGFYVDILRYVRHHHRQLLSITKDKSPQSAAVSGCRDGPVNTISQGDGSTAAERMRAQINKREIEVTKNLFIIFCAFFCCLMPSCIAFSIQSSHKTDLYTGIVILINGCVNPFIYAFKHPQYKTAFKAIINCRIKQLQKDVKYTTKTV